MSAFLTVVSRCAITLAVLSRVNRPSASKTSSSDAASSPELGSSRVRIGESRMMARAIAMRWRCPPESVAPRSQVSSDFANESPTGISFNICSLS